MYVEVKLQVCKNHRLICTNSHKDDFYISAVQRFRHVTFIGSLLWQFVHPLDVHPCNNGILLNGTQ